MKLPVRLFLSLAFLAAGNGSVHAQEVATPAPPPPARPPEGAIIINFPSADVPPLRTLQLHFTHRFADPVQDSNIHNLFSFDSGAQVGIGLSYSPIENLEAGFLRERTLEDYEVFARYAVLSGASPVHVALRAGADWRTERNYPERFTFFAQAIAGAFLWDRIRISVIPTFATKAAGQRFVLPIRDNVFNVLFAVSAAVTRTINIQAEMIPRTARSPGTGWIVAIEKTLLRHRFSFTAGNTKATTVDQYIAPDFNGLPRSNIYLGFNIIRQWKL
ncbi:MAG: DUF5777 family beta-barrel protein [Thermoanaerobaculia bacterium]